LGLVHLLVRRFGARGEKDGERNQPTRTSRSMHLTLSIERGL
jgi:hypothetical protein